MVIFKFENVMEDFKVPKYVNWGSHSRMILSVEANMLPVFFLKLFNNIIKLFSLFPQAFTLRCMCFLQQNVLLGIMLIFFFMFIEVHV